MIARCAVAAAAFGLLLFLNATALPAAETSDFEELRKRSDRPILSTPAPDYPYEARRRQITGSGVAIMEVDPASGVVTRAFMEQSTGSHILDNAVINGFRRWRFKPGAVARVRVPVTFTLLGGYTSTEYVVRKKSMDDVLAAFLGKGTVLKGPIPEYPRSEVWTNKSGKGVYELHAGKDGKVTQVRVLKSSSDAAFDRVAVKTLGKWRLRRGPLVIELPLRFTLTPANYSVDVGR